MRCALGHGPSSFLRIGAIHGVPDEYREFFFDTCHHRLHRVTLHQSPVSLRDLARTGPFQVARRHVAMPWPWPWQGVHPRVRRCKVCLFLSVGASVRCGTAAIPRSARSVSDGCVGV